MCTCRVPGAFGGQALRSALVAGVFGLGLLMAGGVSRAEDAKVQVVATTTLVADLVREVGGSRVQMEALMGPGVDPHLYKPSARDIGRLGRAEVVFYSGLHLEGRLEEVLRRLTTRGVRVTAVAEAVPESERMRAPDDPHPDPHVWGDPGLWEKAAGAVADTLVAVDPEGATYYRERQKAYAATLTSLRKWAGEQVATIPEARRLLITSHDAFNYLGRATGMEVLGVQGISTVSEAGLADMTLIIDRVRERQLPAVFVESSVSPAAMDRISRDSGARIGGELFSDALGAPGEIRERGGERLDVGTYVGMFRYNVLTIVEALR